MTVHEFSKRVTVHNGGIEWLAECSCGWERLVRLESEADIDIDSHRMAVERQRLRLDRVYAIDLEDDGLVL